MNQTKCQGCEGAMEIRKNGCSYYVCKYTPLELMAAFEGEYSNLNHMPEGFELADQVINPNVCGFGKALMQSVMAGEVHELVLVNCCDTIRSVYDILRDSKKLDFLYMIDMLHSGWACSREQISAQLIAFAKAYRHYKGQEFDEAKFRAAFHPPKRLQEPHLSVLGARMGKQLFEMVQDCMPLPVQNDSCVNNRSVGEVMPPTLASLREELLQGTECSGTAAPEAAQSPRTDGDVLDSPAFARLMDWYAYELIKQIPCMRMMDKTGRRALLNDPNLKGIIYHTIKFCDFYSFEYADLRQHAPVPILKIESDYTTSSSGQLLTRLEAFAESIDPEELEGKKTNMGKGYFAGIDSGSTSTDVVILDKDNKMVCGIIVPTGAGAQNSAEKALEEALRQSGLARTDIDAMVTTGYGRTAIEDGDKSITEITCHARGAHFLEPEVRTVIDIGGQDSKVIRLDDKGNVINFVMNDKCAAGTGRFLEMMAHSLELSLEEMSLHGLNYKEDITISSMCSVFAQSEVVSLIAENKSTDDIVHGLNKSVAVKTSALVKRVGGEGKYMMTGGVSKNKGLVKTLEEKVGAPIIIREEAQLCGALGAALFARDMVKA
ncbi:acyl-CoA dehydratase activase [Oribacterium sp. HCP28S3_H8]|uniref:acyl-CoA dehydratase activase n=1 Tax=Oribacterium sp. HCP28S3_H8 TaxID=3438945 RepID=UPI003F8C01A4